MTNDQKQKAQEMRHKGASYSRISLALGISKNTIKSYCRRNKLSSEKNIKQKLKAVKEKSTDCMHCKKTLIRGTRGQPKKFCAKECRRLWWKTNDGLLMKRAYYTIKCIECGKKFESYGNKNRKFCGHACYIRNRYGKGEGGQ